MDARIGDSYKRTQALIGRVPICREDGAMVSFRESESELVEYFTECIGVRAQNYGAFGSGGGEGDRDAEEVFVTRLPGQRRALAHRDVVVATLAHLSGWDRFVVERLYTPRRWCGDFLAVSLNGGGVAYNLASIAPMTDRAQRFAARQRQLQGSAIDDDHSILALLEEEALNLQKKADEDEKKRKAASVLRKPEKKPPTLIEVVRVEAEAMRDAALEAYDVVRVQRRRARKREGDAAYVRTLAGML